MTKETKQTALEQFAIVLYEKGLLIGNGDWMQDVLQEFKEIEKQEMIEFANDLLAQNDINYIGVPNLAEQYYEQTYGNKHIGDANEMVGGEQ
jgi:hypothetical protein